MRSPLKEVNGGSKALLAVKRLIPPGSVINSFGLLDGALEVDLAFNKRFVVARTTKYVIYEFWSAFLRKPEIIAQAAQDLHPIENQAIFNILQENWPKYKDPYLRSALFFLLNRCSNNGMISMGQMTSDHFNPLAFTTLKNFKINNFHLLLDDEEYLDKVIPTLNEEEWLLFSNLAFSFNLLEHGSLRAFETTPTNHTKLKTTIDDLSNNAVLIYRYHPQVFKLYKDYNITMIDKYGQHTELEDKCREIIVANF